MSRRSGAGSHGPGAAYTRNAMANPYLYRAMFDAAVDLENPEAADAGFRRLVAAAERARQSGRFAGPAIRWRSRPSSGPPVTD